MFESDADRLALIKAVGGEPFSTDFPDKLWGVFDRPFEESTAGDFRRANQRAVIECRTSDVELHGLVKHSRITRDKDGKSYAIKDFEDDGTGMTVLVLAA